MASMWYYSNKSQQKGPVTWEELSGLAQAGQLRGSDLVWQEGTPDWVKASTVDGLLQGSGRVATDVRADEPAPRRAAGRERDKGERDRDDRPRRSIRKPQNSSRGLMIGLIAGGGALLVIAIVVIIIVVANSGGDNKKKEVVGGPRPKPTPVPIGIEKPPIDILPGARVITATREGTRISEVLAAADGHDPLRPGSFCKIYEVQFLAGRSYTIDLTAGFDPMLRILDAGGGQVAFNDDWGGSLDSKIIFTPIVAGPHRVVCTSYRAGSTGPFTLILREN